MLECERSVFFRIESFMSYLYGDWLSRICIGWNNFTHLLFIISEKDQHKKVTFARKSQFSGKLFKLIFKQFIA